MTRFTRRTLVAVATVATLAASGLAQAQERAFKFALQNPKGHPLATGAEKFAELVAAKSKGHLKINVFAGGTLGGDAATVSALQGGTVEIVMLNSGILASQVKDFEVFDFPFMFANAKEADAVVDAPSARSCTPSWPTRASLVWPTRSWAFATSPTASAPSTRSMTSPA